MTAVMTSLCVPLCPCSGQFAIVKKCREKSTGWSTQPSSSKSGRARPAGGACGRVEIELEVSIPQGRSCTPNVITLHDVFENRTDVVLIPSSCEWEPGTLVGSRLGPGGTEEVRSSHRPQREQQPAGCEAPPGGDEVSRGRLPLATRSPPEPRQQRLRARV